MIERFKVCHCNDVWELGEDLKELFIECDCPTKTMEEIDEILRNSGILWHENQ